MSIDAQALFAHCFRKGRRGAGSEPRAATDRVEVAGMVDKVYLGHDNTPVVILRAGLRGPCRVECRFLSDEVLVKAVPGSELVLEGLCRGLEDSVTAVLERCDVVEARSCEGSTARVANRSEAEGARTADAPRRCAFCGLGRADVRRLLTIGDHSICDRCVRECFRRLDGPDTLPGNPAAPDASASLRKWLRRLRSGLARRPRTSSGSRKALTNTAGAGPTGRQSPGELPAGAP